MFNDDYDYDLPNENLDDQFSDADRFVLTDKGKQYLMLYKIRESLTSIADAVDEMVHSTPLDKFLFAHEFSEYIIGYLKEYEFQSQKPLAINPAEILDVTQICGYDVLVHDGVNDGDPERIEIVAVPDYDKWAPLDSEDSCDCSSQEDDPVPCCESCIWNSTCDAKPESINDPECSDCLSEMDIYPNSGQAIKNTDYSCSEDFDIDTWNCTCEYCVPSDDDDEDPYTRDVDLLTMLDIFFGPNSSEKTANSIETVAILCDDTVANEMEIYAEMIRFVVANAGTDNIETILLSDIYCKELHRVGFQVKRIIGCNELNYVPGD